MTGHPTPRRKLSSLAELKGIQKELAALQARNAEAARLAALEKARQDAEQQAHHNLFAMAAGRVNRLKTTPRAALQPAPPPPLPKQQKLDDQAALKESLSDEFDVSTLLEVDDQMSYRQPGIGADVLKKLRKGHWSIQAQLDLHGARREQAREQLGAFLREATRLGLRCVRVVHGKGLGSPGKTPVLKGRVQGWLVQKKEVLAFVQAKVSDGGAGALVLLLAAAPSKS